MLFTQKHKPLAEFSLLGPHCGVANLVWRHISKERRVCRKLRHHCELDMNDNDDWEIQAPRVNHSHSKMTRDKWSQDYFQKIFWTQWGLNPRGRRPAGLKSAPLDHSGIRPFGWLDYKRKQHTNTKSHFLFFGLGQAITKYRISWSMRENRISFLGLCM